MDYDKIEHMLQKLTDTYKKICGEATFTKEPPASEEEILKTEKQAGVRLPTELREFLSHFSKHCEFYAFFSDKIELPYELRELFSAYLLISMDEIINAEGSRKDWLENCFPNQDDPYDKVWHNKLGIMTVANGDVIALDIGINAENPPVIYLSHDDGDGHGAILGKTFNHFLEALLQVGCCGNEDWQMLPFCKDSQSGIDPSCNNAIKYRQIIGI